MDHWLRTPKEQRSTCAAAQRSNPRSGTSGKFLAELSRRGQHAALTEAHLAATATVFKLLKIHRSALT